MTTANVVFSGPASNVAPLKRSAVIDAGNTILPGMLVNLDADGEFQLLPTGGGASSFFIADMNVIEQKSATEALTIGDMASAFVPEVGCTYNLVLKDGQTIAVGDPLTSEANTGLVVKATLTGATPDTVMFVAEEALSPSGANGRIRARYVGVGIKHAS